MTWACHCLRSSPPHTLGGADAGPMAQPGPCVSAAPALLLPFAPQILSSLNLPLEWTSPGYRTGGERGGKRSLSVLARILCKDKSFAELSSNFFSLDCCVLPTWGNFTDLAQFPHLSNRRINSFSSHGVVLMNKLDNICERPKTGPGKSKSR